MDITTETRDKGVYVIRTVGMQYWSEGAGTWRAHGVRLQLMDGPDPLADCTLEVPGTLAAEERGEQEAAAIEPWARTLRYLRVTAGLRTTLSAARDLLDRATAGVEKGWILEEDDVESLRGLASEEEIAEAAASVRREPPRAVVAEVPVEEFHQALAAAVVRRLSAQVDAGLRRALAQAPDPAAHPIHPAWQARYAYVPGKSLVQDIARELLAGWAAVRDLRDLLVTWAVREAELTRTEVQQTTGVSRSTINRLLPAEAG